MKFNGISKYFSNSYWLREIVVNLINIQYKNLSFITHFQFLAQILHYYNHMEYYKYITYYNQ